MNTTTIAIEDMKVNTELSPVPIYINPLIEREFEIGSKICQEEYIYIYICKISRLIIIASKKRRKETEKKEKGYVPMDVCVIVHDNIIVSINHPLSYPRSFFYALICITSNISLLLF